MSNVVSDIIKERKSSTPRRKRIKPRISKVKAFLPRVVWLAGGAALKKSLENGIAKMGVEGVNIAELFDNTRNDYIELLLGNTLSLDGAAALNNANNLAHRDTFFNDEWNRRGVASNMFDKTVDIIQQLTDWELQKDEVDFEAALTKKDTLIEKISAIEFEQDQEEKEGIEEDITNSEERIAILFSWLQSKYLTDDAREDVVKKLNELAAWNKKAGTFLGPQGDFETKTKTESDNRVQACRGFKAVFNVNTKLPDNKLPTGVSQAQLETMQEYWKDKREYNDDIQQLHTDCENKNTAYYEKVNNVIGEWRGPPGNNKLPAAYLDTVSARNALKRQSTSNDKYSSTDSVFDIMIRNNENLITALIGKAEGDGSTNLLKTVMDSLDKNSESIGAKLDAVKMGLSTFTKKLTAKFTAIKSWSAAIASHQHTALPAGK